MFFTSWLFFLLLYAYLAFEYQIYWLSEVILPLSIVTATVPSVPFVLSEWILKWLSKRWMFSRFRLLPRLFRTLIFDTIVYFIVFFYFSWKYGPLPLWTLFLTIALLGVLLVSIVLSDIFSDLGEGILSIMAFEEDFKNDPSKADFGRILFAAKKVSQIVKSYNLEVSPYRLSLGMTLSFIGDSKETQKDFNDLIGWMEDPTEKANFEEFQRIVKKFNSVAEKSSRYGLAERHHWSFETKIALLGAIVIPIAVTILAIVLPKLFELLSRNP